MKFLKGATATFILIFSLNSFSQNTGATTFPAEIWYCEINEGFSMQDVRDVSMGVKKFSEENGMKGTQYLTTTFMGSMNPKAFELMTAWPSFEVMGKGFDDFLLPVLAMKFLQDGQKLLHVTKENWLLLKELGL